MGGTFTLEEATYSAPTTTTRLEARRTGADIVAGSSVAVSIASEAHPYRAVLAYGTPEVWRADARRWLERIATR